MPSPPVALAVVPSLLFSPLTAGLSLNAAVLQNPGPRQRRWHWLSDGRKGARTQRACAWEDSSEGNQLLRTRRKAGTNQVLQGKLLLQQGWDSIPAAPRGWGQVTLPTLPGELGVNWRDEEKSLNEQGEVG